MTQWPHQMEFVLSVPEAGAVREHAGFELYLPAGAGGPLPAVVVVPGAITAQYPIRPWKWPVYTGYGRLLASRGVAAAVVNLPFHDTSDAPGLVDTMAGLVASVRELPEVDADRI